MEDPLHLIKNAINKITTKEGSDLSFNEIYFSGYKAVQNREAENVYKTIIDVVKTHLKTRILPLVTAKLTEDQIDPFVQSWIDHQVCLECYRKLFHFIDKDVSSRLSLQTLQNTGIEIFNKEIFIPNKDAIRTILLNAIDAERNGQVVSNVPIKTIIDFLLISSSLQFYVEYFEESFLKESERFYKLKVEEYTRADSVINYINYYEKSVLEEKRRVGKYLHEITKEKLLKLLKEIFILKNLKNMQLEKDCHNILNDDSQNTYHYMQVLYEWFSVCNDLQKFRNLISDIFREKGLSIIEGKKYQDHSEKIENLLKLKKSFGCFEEHCFKDLEIRTNLDSDFIYIFNKNGEIPEYLSTYIHKIILKEKKFPESELEEKIVSFFDLYKILVDKDVFEDFYKINLGRRLLSVEPASSELENKVISRLKMDCASITAQLEEMMKDVQISNTHMEMFLNDLEINEHLMADFEFSMTVLKDGLWRFESCPPCILPPVFSSVFEIYHEFYNRQHTGRKLLLQINLGFASLYGYFLNATGKTVKYTFTVSTIQMLILILFNDHDSLTIKEITELTEISAERIKCALIPLIKPRKAIHKILLKEKGDENNSFGENDKISVNKKYVAPTRRIKLPFRRSTVEEVTSNSQEVWRKTEANRRLEIDAAIVRVMKSRRVLPHVALVEEVINLVKNRFKPKVMTIDSRISHLIEKEYIAKDPKEEKTYVYLP